MSSVFASAVLAAPAQKVDLEALQAQIQALQAQINELKAAQANNASKEEVNKQIDELHERADANELQSALDKIKFGLDFSTAVNSVRATNDTTGTGGKRSNNNESDKG